MSRIVAALGAVVLGLAALFGAILLVFVAAAAAEPGTATNRGETFAVSVVLTVLEGALVAGMVLLAVYAASGRFAAWRLIVGGTLGGALALGVLAGVSL
jgi:hypothetical protein